MWPVQFRHLADNLGGGRAHRRRFRSAGRLRLHSGRSLERRRGFPCESYCCALIDAFLESVYIHTMPVGKIQVGQVWKKDDSGESYLITKVYNEAIATFALLRKTGAEAEGTIKIKVDQRGPSQALPGFTYTQESDHF